MILILILHTAVFPLWTGKLPADGYVPPVCAVFSEFRHKLLSGESLLYSWDVGMGVNFAALYAYYLASPFNWLLLLCPSSLIIEFMTYMIVFKSGLAGLSMAWYLKSTRVHRSLERAISAYSMRCPAIWRRIAGISCGWTASCCCR